MRLIYQVPRLAAQLRYRRKRRQSTVGPDKGLKPNKEMQKNKKRQGGKPSVNTTWLTGKIRSGTRRHTPELLVLAERKVRI